MIARTARRQRPRSARKIVAVGVGTAVVVGGGGAALALTGSNGPSYRLASVSRGTIDQTVSTTGTIASVNSATLHFPVSGTVADVAVKVGDAVRAGQTVATLNTTELRQQLQQAQAAAASARQTLANDLAQQSSGGSDDGASDGSDGSASNTATPAPTAAPSSSTPSKPSGPSTAELVAAIKRAQQKLLADQHAADIDADLVASAKAIVAANSACAALLAQTPTPTASSSASSSTSSTSSTADDLAACQQAIADVQAAQQKVQHDLELLTADEKALDAAVAALIAALERSSESGGSRTSSAGPSAAHPSTSSSTTATDKSSGSNGGDGSSGTTVTAAQLAADQKRIDAADAQVTVAKQAVQQATLGTPISGTVAAVSMAEGDSVSAGSTTATITVVGSGQTSVQVLVGIRDIDLVKSGQSTSVTVDGVSKPLTGHVTLIGVLNSSGTSGDSSTYPVTIVLDGSPRLFDGAGASVSIAVGAASNVLTVPVSAMHGSGTNTTVTLYRNGSTESRRVTVGARGIDRIEIRSGLSAGDQVVLARVDAAVPTSSNNQGRFGRNGEFGGIGGGGPVVIQGPKGGR